MSFTERSRTSPVLGLSLWALAFAAALSAGIAIHARSMRRFETVLEQAQRISRKQELAQSMSIEVERYRRASTSFRKMGFDKEAEAKERLRSQAEAFSSHLRSLDPTTEDATRDENARRKLQEFLKASAKLEPMLFTRDVFQKEEMRDLYVSIGAEWEAIAQNAREQASHQQDHLAPESQLSLRLIAAFSSLAALLVVALLARQYFRVIRPARLLRERVEAWTEWAQAPGSIASPAPLKRHLPAIFQKVEEAMGSLSATVRAQRNERLEFISAISTDLRPPLNQLQAAVEVLASGKDAALMEAAKATAASASFRLSKTLEDLSDLIDLPSSRLKLHEKIVDLRTVVSAVTDSISPPLPVWTHIDGDRFERVLVHLLSKLTSLLPQGSGIETQIHAQPESGYRGVEITLSERNASFNSNGASTGASEQPILNHWVSQTGFGMKLAHRILEAHGGSISVLGTAGNGLCFIVRIPAERVALGLLTPAPLRSGNAQDKKDKKDNPAQPSVFTLQTV